MSTELIEVWIIKYWLCNYILLWLCIYSFTDFIIPLLVEFYKYIFNLTNLQLFDYINCFVVLNLLIFFLLFWYLSLDTFMLKGIKCLSLPYRSFVDIYLNELNGKPVQIYYSAVQIYYSKIEFTWIPNSWFL